MIWQQNISSKAGNWGYSVFISAGADEKRELDRIRKNVGLMNAEKIYGYLKKTKESEIDWLEKIFRRDDHTVSRNKKQE